MGVELNELAQVVAPDSQGARLNVIGVAAAVATRRRGKQKHEHQEQYRISSSSKKH
jgi:hypothetical protein